MLIRVVRDLECRWEDVVMKDVERLGGGSDGRNLESLDGEGRKLGCETGLS